MSHSLYDFQVPITYLHIVFYWSQVSDVGATGQLSFREDGTRQGYTVDVLGLGNDGLYKV